MSADNSNPAYHGILHDTVLLLAREQEWAEAYCADHPVCELGLVYLGFLRQEIANLLLEL